MLNVATVALVGEPIAVGETTTLGEGLITTADYLPAPSVEQAAIAIAIFAREIEAQGLNVREGVRHVVVRKDTNEGVYVTAKVLPTDDDADLDNLEYVRVL